MNLNKLFETQKVLRDRIGYNEPDRFDKLILATLVEIGECANEKRCFKFWSHKPASAKAIILEEYVDIVHFALEIGLELDLQQDDIELLENKVKFETYKRNTLTEQFNALFYFATRATYQFDYFFNCLVGLGEMLGFTWGEVEAAYFEKNKINHQRQNSGSY